ncbi:MAG: Spx/MgsR family RNA polymerase-binding regulatory protein [Bacilli bacterium]|jgi:regulatory protein spx|nr:Spx/MgsR family RNA polymerase-binding regulatory protein [Bacilli bacterium]MDD2681362.1 Spx/MgsR family RNA polymerase-binding regulatory protein [Bacilli bacterium]MDD3120871.1 Spx/MgsR family RNA polymerase-binding regulatory protein [Bacilli bacterium]MDD4063066.1 Spx/MgsR family RNA polymerase-binding regulatory protein [Bacilli bacterium]MDD4481654.1 Spx/MgsR family RNA polymerase-binding regulatory protein [Bacilli bacterium]
MIKLYISPSCSSCRKVKKYFDHFNIKYEEKNIINTPISKDEILKMLMKSENGFEDIISTRSKIFKEKNFDIDNMKLNQLVDFIIENPTVLKRPIIVTDYELQVGYNEDDITLFLPEDFRNLDCDKCENYARCEYLNNLNFK